DVPSRRGEAAYRGRFSRAGADRLRLEGDPRGEAPLAPRDRADRTPPDRRRLARVRHEGARHRPDRRPSHRPLQPPVTNAADDDRGRTTVVRTSFWFTMAMATIGLVVGLAFADEISQAFRDVGPGLVRATFVGVWAQMNYEQLTSLFRVEQRALAFGLASLA